MPESAPARIAFLRERIEAARALHGPTAQVPFRQRQIDLPRIEVPIDFPLYRVQNGRTHRAQSRYIDRKGLSPDFFFADPESKAVQDAQHEILLGMIAESDLDKDLREHPQQSPLLLTYDGFIVNGNRRTAALRDKGDVEQLIAVVLPDDADASDLYQTELEVQMARDTKAPYNWIDQGLHLRYGVEELEEPLTSIARRMHFEDSYVTQLLGRMTLVDLYLEWLGASNKYHLIGASEHSQSEQAFRDLYERERSRRFKSLSELQQRLVRTACFTVINQGGGYKDVRRVAETLIKRPQEVLQRMRPDLPEALLERLEQPLEIESPTPRVTLKLFDELAEAEHPAEPPAGAELLNLVKTPGCASQVAPVLAGAAEDVIELEAERQQRDEPFRKLERVLRTLRDVSLLATTPRLDEIAATLTAIVERADQLSGRLNDLRSDGK